MRRQQRYLHSSRHIAQEIRDLYFARVFKQIQLAKLYGLAQGSVSRIVSRQVWQ